MGGHAFPPEFANDHDGFVDLICEEILPAVQAQGMLYLMMFFAENGYSQLHNLGAF
jgi:imidazolonepropionase